MIIYIENTLTSLDKFLRLVPSEQDNLGGRIYAVRVWGPCFISTHPEVSGQNPGP